MISPFATLFLQLQQQITAAVPALQHIDQDLGQLDYYKQKPPVSFPCVLIDFEDFTAANYSEQVQELSGNVIIRLAFAPYSSTTGSTPALYREKALASYDIEYALHKALQGYIAGDRFGSLCRKHIKTEHRGDPIRVRNITYSVTFEDYSVQTPLDTNVAVPVLTTEV